LKHSPHSTISFLARENERSNGGNEAWVVSCKIWIGIQPKRVSSSYQFDYDAKYSCHMDVGRKKIYKCGHAENSAELPGFSPENAYLVGADQTANLFSARSAICNRTP
jgi:hypothetical protein